MPEGSEVEDWETDSCGSQKRLSTKKLVPYPSITALYHISYCIISTVAMNTATICRKLTYQ